MNARRWRTDRCGRIGWPARVRAPPPQWQGVDRCEGDAADGRRGRLASPPEPGSGSRAGRTRAPRGFRRGLPSVVERIGVGEGCLRRRRRKSRSSQKGVGGEFGGLGWFAWGESEDALYEADEAAALYTDSSCTSQEAWASARRVFYPRIARNVEKRPERNCAVD